MADLSYLASEKPLAILGLGVSGKAVADACKKSGVKYHAWVDDEASREALKTNYVLHDFSNDLSAYTALVPAAGIKPSHPIIRKAKAQNIPILSDIDLLFRSASDATFVGITGTNGKSTTTALIGHILKEAGKNVAIGGNIGVAACSLPSLGKDGIYVLEMSSYMLEITAQAIFDIAAVTNISEDHLDWHGTAEHYIASKRKIFRPRNDRIQKAVLCTDGAINKQIAHELDKATHEVVTVSAEKSPIADHPFLKGDHNRENIAVAFAVCRALGLNDAEIKKHVLTFEGLAHRQKIVAKKGSVTFVNDSKATNADATQHALNAFDHIYWIVGGVAKADGIDGLERFYPKIEKAFLIGEASDRFAKKLEDDVPFVRSGTMEQAVKDAYQAAQDKGGEAVILLSPACASFDQYKNFEERGAHFEKLVKEMIA